jgi:hypothetical protein
MADPITDLLNAGTDVASGVTSVTKKTKKLLVDIDSLILELTGLMVVSLEIPRSDEELSDEERQTIAALRVRQDELVTEIHAAGGSDEDEVLKWYIDVWDDFFSLPGQSAILPADQLAHFKKLHDLSVDIRRFRLAIHTILYHPAGVIPDTLNNFNETIERFHALEQPRIETIMDSSDDAIRETTEILEEVKKLFVTKKWIAKDTSRLTAKEMADLEWLKQQKLAYTHLIDKYRVISDQVHKNMIQFTGPVKNTKMATTGAGRPDIEEIPGANRGTAGFRGIASQYISLQNLAYIKGFTALQGSLSSYERELFRIEKKITGLSFELVDEPGVIPKALEDVHLSVHRFRTEEQPRIEKILDITAETLAESRVVLVSVDATVNESKNLVSQLNTSLGKVQGWFDFVSTYRVPLLIGCAVFGILVFAIMVTFLIVLIKMALA